MHRCTKHIVIRFHFIRSLISEGVVYLEYYGANEQVADVLTKVLSIQSMNISVPY